MKKLIFFFTICLLTNTINAQNTASNQAFSADTIQQSNAQTSTKQEELKQSAIKKENIYYGGYANLSFGSYTAIGFEPMIGYKLTPKLSFGGKLSYEYIKDKRYTEDYETSNYGFSIFSRYRIVPQLYAHAEFSAMNYELYYFGGDSDRKWVPFLFLGGGYSQPITKNTWLTAEVLFDVLQNENSPYKNWEPFFSIGFGVGF